MKRFTKALSMLLAIIMVVGLLPLTILAEDIQSTHTVQFKLNYNGAHKITSQKVKDGECAVQPEGVAREGWLFEYWYVKTGDGIQRFDLTQPITEDVTLYARWDEDPTYWGRIWDSRIRDSITDDEEYNKITYTVSFNANGDNVENLPVEQKITEGECAVEPEAPNRTGYLFLGWSLSEAGEIFSFNTIITKDITLYAQWKKDENEVPESSNDKGSSVYSITGLTVNDNTVTVTVNAVDECNLKMTFYADNAPEYTRLASASAIVAAGVQMEDVHTQITAPLPEYFVVVAQLFDSENNALCNTYTCIKYTRAYEEFAKKTIQDFPGKTVLNFDESPDNNFGVLADNVKSIDCNDGVNILLEYSENQYVFENATKDITGLSKGDIIHIDNNTGEDYLVKVETVSTQNGRTTITTDTDTALNEFYSYLKIDMEVYAQNTATPQTYNMMQRNIVDIDETYKSTIGLNCSYENKFFEVKISGSGELKVHLVVIYDLELFGEDYCQFDFKVTTTVTIATDVVGKLETPPNDDEDETKIELPEVLIPFGVTGLAAKVSPAISLKLKLNAGLYMSQQDKKFVTGFTFNTIDGYHPIENRDDGSTPDPEIKAGGKIEITVGPEINISIAFLDEAFEGKLVFFVGGRLKGETLHSLTDTNEAKHGCTLCIDGTVDLVANVKAKLTYKITDHFKGTPFDATLIERSIHLFNFIFSIINDTDSMFHGAVTFIKTDDCPNIAYRVNVYAVDDDGNSINDVEYVITNTDTQTVLSDKTPGTHYLYNGFYKISATVLGKQINSAFKINGEPQNIYLSETGLADYNLIGHYYSKYCASSYIEFTDNESGIIHIVPFDTVSAYNKDFTYSISGDIITIKSCDSNFGFSLNGKWINTLRFKIILGDEIMLKSLDSWGNVSEGDIFAKQKIFEADLVGRTYTQSTSVMYGNDYLISCDPIPKITFDSINTGTITLNYLEGYVNKTFTYEVINNRLILSSVNDFRLYIIEGIAQEMEFIISDDNTLKLIHYSPRILEGEGSGGQIVKLGVTYIGDIFTSSETTLPEADVGETIYFGYYEQDNDFTNGIEPIEWKVLAKENGKMLLLSEYVLDAIPFDNPYPFGSGDTWQDCSLREWLNTTFINQSFTETQKDCILTTNLSTVDYRENVFEQTEDKIFVLSDEEYNQYFPEDYDKKTSLKGVTRYANAQGAPSFSRYETWGGWWLRNRINYPVSYAIMAVKYNGKIDVLKSFDGSGSVRPAMWVSISD